jgi:hypothetical protein
MLYQQNESVVFESQSNKDGHPIRGCFKQLGNSAYTGRRMKVYINIANYNKHNVQTFFSEKKEHAGLYSVV